MFARQYAIFKVVNEYLKRLIYRDHSINLIFITGVRWSVDLTRNVLYTCEM